MTTPHSPSPTTATDIADIDMGDSVRLAAAGVLEASALNLTRFVTEAPLTLGQVIDTGRPQDDCSLDDAVATVTHLVLTCLAHVHRDRGLLDGLPDLPEHLDTIAGCLRLVDHEVATWTRTVTGPDLDPNRVRSAARIAVAAADRELA